MSKGSELAQRVKDAIDQMTATVKAVQHDFEAYIVDQSIPLDERWQVWVNAPSNLKTNASYIQHFASLPSDAIMYEGDIFHADKYQTVDMVDVVEVLEEWKQIVEDGEPDKDNWEHKYWQKAVDFYEEYSLEAFKEEILASNLDSFTYDW